MPEPNKCQVSEDLLEVEMQIDEVKKCRILYQLCIQQHGINSVYCETRLKDLFNAIDQLEKFKVKLRKSAKSHREK